LITSFIESHFAKALMTGVGRHQGIAEMYLKFRCGNCDHEMIVQFLKPGEVAKCKACGADNVVPADTIATDGTPPKGQVVKPLSQQAEAARAPVIPVTLTSEGLGSFVTILLWVGVVVSLVEALGVLAAFGTGEGESALTKFGRFAQQSSPSNWTALTSGTQLLIGLVLLFGLVSLVIDLVWMYRVHRDLDKLYPGYKISPGQAVARLLIPVYNFWGIWSVFATLSGKLRQEVGKVREQGSTLYTLLIALYVGVVCEIVFHVLGRTSQAWSLTNGMLGLLTSVIAVVFALAIRRALRFKRDAVNSTISAR
jgi:ribosomal protein S27E